MIKRILKEHIWWPIKHRIVHPRRKYRNAVFPPKHRSLDDVIVAACLQAVVESVDRGNCFGNINYEVNENWKTFAAELRECYEYAIIDRNKLIDKINAAWLAVSDITPSFGPVMKLEEELNTWDTEGCHWVINNRTKLHG